MTPDPLTPAAATDADFRRLTLDDVAPLSRRLAAEAPWRTCDFTIGGLYLWADWFDYRMGLVGPGESLVFSGASEADLRLPAFSMPLGGDLAGAVEALKALAAARGHDLRLSAVPMEAVPQLMALGPAAIEELPQWADYLYSADDLATLPGKRYNKKRNHYNRFRLDNPGYQLLELDAATLPAARAFVAAHAPGPDAGPMAIYEHAKALRALELYELLPFEGVVLTVPGRGVVAVTFGEVAGDTLHSHVEKMDHEVSGAGETVCTLFAGHMLERHPGLRYINRQDDAGDPGLRRAKESWQPVALLRKCDVVFPRG